MKDEQNLVVNDINDNVMSLSNDESLDENNYEIELSAIQEELKNLVKIQKKAIKSQNEVIEIFSDSTDASSESEIEFNEKFLELYSQNSSKILEQLELVNSSSVSLIEQMNVSNIKLDSTINLGIIGICGLGFLCGSILMAVFSRYLKH